jgi:hypothetical protein
MPPAKVTRAPLPTSISVSSFWIATIPESVRSEFDPVPPPKVTPFPLVLSPTLIRFAIVTGELVAVVKSVPSPSVSTPLPTGPEVGLLAGPTELAPTMSTVPFPATVRPPENVLPPE